MRYNEGMIDAIEAMRECVGNIESMLDTQHLGDTLNVKNEFLVTRNLALVECMIENFKRHAKLEG